MRIKVEHRTCDIEKQHARNINKAFTARYFSSTSTQELSLFFPVAREPQTTTLSCLFLSLMNDKEGERVVSFPIGR